MNYHIAVANKVIASFYSVGDRDTCFDLLSLNGNHDFYKVDDVPGAVPAREATKTTQDLGRNRMCKVRQKGDAYVFTHKGKERRVTAAQGLVGFSHFLWIDGERTVALCSPAKYLDMVVFDE